MTTKKEQDKAKETEEKKAQSTQSNEQKNTQETADSGFWDEAKDNVSEGAKIVGEEAKRIGGKISSYSEKIFGKISESASDVYKISTEFTKDAVNSAQELAEKYKDKYEINKLNNQKKHYATQLGMRFYLDIKNNDNRIPRGFLDENDIKGLISKLEKIDKEVLELTKDEEEKEKS